MISKMAVGYLTVWDYLVIAASFAFSISIGVYYAFSGGRQKTTAEFMLGNRNLKILPVALSLVVSYESSIMMIGFPGEIYTYGLQYLFASIGNAAAAAIIAVFVVPLYHDLQVVSTYEYIEARFDSRLVRLVGCFVSMMGTAMYMAIVLYGPATAIEAITGFSTWNSVVIMSIVAVIYTSLGGIKAVVWVDAFQSIFMIAGLLILLVIGTMAVGSADDVVDYCSAGGRFNFPSVSVNPLIRVSWWSAIIGQAVAAMKKSMTQTTIQRVTSMPTLRGAKIVVLALVPGTLLFNGFSALTGLVAYAYYQHIGCDPLTSGAVSNPSQIIPYFMLEVFSSYPGLPGLFLSALCSASLSTLSSGYASLATLTWTDFLQPLLPNISDRKATIITKCSVVLMGALVAGLAFIMMNVSSTMTQMSGDFIQAFTSPSVGVFLIAALIPSVNTKGVISGCIFGAVVGAWKGYGANFILPDKFKRPYLPLTTENCNMTYDYMFLNDTLSTTAVYDIASINTTLNLTDNSNIYDTPLYYFYGISHLWNSLLGTFVTITTALVVSYITGARDPKTVNPKLLIPVRKIIRGWFRTKPRDESLNVDIPSLKMNDIELKNCSQLNSRLLDSDGHDEHSSAANDEKYN